MLKLGRKPRGHDPRIPHMSALLAGQSLPPPPPAVDYTVDLPASLGAMLNDTLGDCTCAAWGHAVQVWTANSQPPMRTLTNGHIEALYEAVGGYRPGDPSTDQGCMEQDVLTYLVTTGLRGNHLSAFVEVDPRNTDDVRRTIADCGVAYIGFRVPNFMMANLTKPESTWNVDPGADNGIAGGHAVVLAGYNLTGVRVISWGNFYTMTWAFFAAFVDEVYALADRDWMAATGLSPAGLNLLELEQQMQALKA